MEESKIAEPHRIYWKTCLEYPEETYGRIPLEGRTVMKKVGLFGKRQDVLLSAVTVIFLLIGLVGESYAQSRRGKGFVRESAEVFRSFPVAPRYRAFLPPEVDLSSRFPTPGHQGQQSSCTSWAVGYAMRSYYEGRRRDWRFSSSDQIISPAYIFNRLQDPGSECATGITISSALELLKNEGSPTLSQLPYSSDNCASPRDPTIARVAAEFRIRSWRALDASKLDDPKGQLYNGNPVVFGMDISASFEALASDEIYDDLNSPRTEGHAMVMVGYSESRQAFKVMNSWGTEWANGGFGWISYRVVQQHADRMFVMEVPMASEAPLAPVMGNVTTAQPQIPSVSQPTTSLSGVGALVTGPAVLPPDLSTKPTSPIPTPTSTLKPEPASSTTSVSVAPNQPSIASVLDRVKSRIKDVPCSRLDATLSSARVLQVSGFAGAGDNVSALRAELQAIPGVRQVDTKVRIHTWPQCEVHLSFAEALAENRGAMVTLRGGQGSVFRAGDSLVIDVVTPTYPSYLYVSYLQANGEVVHLAWPDGRNPRAVPPNSRISFGGGVRGQPDYRIDGPFGEEMVIVVASASPLFREALPVSATDREYLTSFRKAFLTAPRAGGGKRNVTAVTATLKTTPR